MAIEIAAYCSTTVFGVSRRFDSTSLQGHVDRYSDSPSTPKAVATGGIGGRVGESDTSVLFRTPVQASGNVHVASKKIEAPDRFRLNFC